MKYVRKVWNIEPQKMLDYILETDKSNGLHKEEDYGTYWLQDEEWAEPMEFTEDELVDEGIYLNEYNQRT